MEGYYFGVHHGANAAHPEPAADDMEPKCQRCPHLDSYSEKESITETGKHIWQHERCRSEANCIKEFACRTWNIDRAADRSKDGPAIGVGVGLIVAAATVTVIVASRDKARHSIGQSNPDDSSAPDTSTATARAVACAKI